MSDELKQIEMETARIRLERERMALNDELRKRQRTETVRGVAAEVTSVVNTDNGRRLLKLLGKAALWLAAAYVLLMAAVFIGFKLGIT